MRDEQAGEKDENERYGKRRHLVGDQSNVWSCLGNLDEACRQKQEYPGAGTQDGRIATQYERLDEDIDQSWDGGEGTREEDERVY